MAEGLAILVDTRARTSSEQRWEQRSETVLAHRANMSGTESAKQTARVWACRAGTGVLQLLAWVRVWERSLDSLWGKAWACQASTLATVWVRRVHT